MGKFFIKLAMFLEILKTLKEILSLKSVFKFIFKHCIFYVSATYEHPHCKINNDSEDFISILRAYLEFKDDNNKIICSDDLGFFKRDQNCKSGSAVACGKDKNNGVQHFEEECKKAIKKLLSNKTFLQLLLNGKDDEIQEKLTLKIKCKIPSRFFLKEKSIVVKNSKEFTRSSIVSLFKICVNEILQKYLEENLGEKFQPGEVPANFITNRIFKSYK